MVFCIFLYFLFRPFLNNKTKDANPIFLRNKHEDGIIEDQSKLLRLLPTVSPLLHLISVATM